MKPVVILYNYQTLIAGVLALCGAAATVWIIGKQIRKTSDLEEQRRSRQNFAARAAMPAALSDLCFYSQKCVEQLVPVLPARPEQRITAEIDAPPPIPMEAILTLRQCIEFADSQIAERIADLIAKLQIQNSRVIGLRERSRARETFMVLRANINELIIDALEIHARCGAFFPYARRAEHIAPAEPTVAAVHLSARLCELHEEHADIHEEIRRRYPAG